jgi:hypothetical protein
MEETVTGLFCILKIIWRKTKLELLRFLTKGIEAKLGMEDFKNE